MNLRFKIETNESIILQLNSQVSHYGARLSRPKNSCTWLLPMFAGLHRSCKPVVR